MLADPDYVEEALLELGGNALRVLAPGGEVVLSAGREGERAVLRVCDDGPGVAEGVRARLFEPFFTTRPDGTGMGLPTVRKVIEQMGGRRGARGDGAGRHALPRGAPARARLGNREVLADPRLDEVDVFVPDAPVAREIEARLVVGVAEPRVARRLDERDVRGVDVPRVVDVGVGKEHLEAQQPLGGLDLEEAVGVVGGLSRGSRRRG